MSGSSSNKISKATRLVNLLFYISEHSNGVTSQQIRNDVVGYNNAKQSDEAFSRQFRRDRKDLANMGYEVLRTNDAQTGLVRYTLNTQKSKQGQLDLDIKDVALLEVCARNALTNPHFFMRKQLLSACSKLNGLQQQVESLSHQEAKANTTNDARQAKDTEQLMQLAQQAHDQQMALAFDYCDAQGQTSARRVVPVAIFRYLGSPYMKAYDMERNQARTFRLSRVEGQAQLQPCDWKSVEAAKLCDDGRLSVLPFQIGQNNCQGVIYFEASAQHKMQQLTASSGTVEKHGQGWLWTVDVADEQAFAQWVIENGPGLLVVQPQSAAQSIQQGLASMFEGAV